MDLAYLTSDLPGTGGVLRAGPEDFRVDEVPLYPPSGEGEHVMFRVWKRGIATFEAVRRIAQALGRPERDIAYAGLKDARAVTTQWMTVVGETTERVQELAIPSLSVLEAHRHRNKLRLGHLRGNRFRIVVRDAPGWESRAPAVLDRLVRRGAPNYFGEQRFGVRLNSWWCGEAILRRDPAAFVARLLGGPSDLEGDPRVREARSLYDEGRIQEAYDAMPVRHRAEKKALHALLRFGDPERALFSIPLRMRQMFVSAFQSYLFNIVVERRLDEIDRIRTGDLAYLHRNGAVFLVEDATEAEPRCRAFEISPSAPIFGTQVPLAEDEPGELERAVLADTGLTAADFQLDGGLRAKGQRRAMRIPLRNVSLGAEGEAGDCYRVEFMLPSGCFATSVLRELMKA